MDSLRPKRPTVLADSRLAPPFVPEAGVSPFPGYHLLRLRGHGAFATVWEARDPNNQLTALKFLSSNNTNGTTAREIRSLQSVQKVEHVSLLKLRNVWSVPGWIVIRMDLADASLLDLFLLYAEEFQKPIEIEKILLYLGQTADALDHLNAHKHLDEGRIVGYQHSDVKPNNILLVGDQAKLADYGLATAMIGPVTPCFRQGTLDYAAPEVFQGTLSDSSDQFSLGVTYYLLRTGAFPFPPPPKSPGRSFYRPPPDLSLVSGAEQLVLSRALASAPADRYPSCVTMIDALAEACKLEIVRLDGLCARVKRRTVVSGRSSILFTKERVAADPEG